MVSNLSSIGFHFADDASFQATIERLASEATKRLACPAGDYAIWRSRTGAELWFHIAATAPGSEERDIIGFTPFFEGRSEVALKLTEHCTRPQDNAFEGAWMAWVAPDDTGEGAYPVLFDAVDSGATFSVEVPKIATARIAGFARELGVFQSEAEHASSHGADRPALAPRAFIPMGLFAAAESDSTTTTQPSSTAILTGRVREHALMKNEATGQSFHWLLVDSLDATYDIVADPALVACEITAGVIVEVACWLVGRITD